MKASGTERSEAPLYNTAAVVRRTGVAATTFRAWERRYGYPKPRRDAKGQRLYSERDIQGIAQPVKITAQPGQTATATFTIDKPGSYTFFCSQPGHEQAGMKGTLTVQ